VTRSSSEKSIWQRAFERFWWFGPILCALLAYRGSFTYDYIADAVFLLEQNTYLHDWSHLWGTLTHDYFWSSSGNTIPYWRPVTKTLWLLEAQFLGIRPEVFHVFQFLWFAGAIGGVMALMRVLGASRSASAVAGGLFALHPATFEPVCLLMARSDVIGVAASLWAVVFWRRALDGNPRSMLWHGLWLVLALGAKESAVVLAPLLTLWAMAPSDGEAFRRPHASWVVRRVGWTWGICLAWMGIRGWILQGAGGMAIDVEFLRIVTGMARYLLALLPFQFETGLFNVSITHAWELLPGSLGLLLAFVVSGVFALRFRQYSIAVMLCWIPAVLAPVLLVDQLNVPNVAGKFPLADRWLLPAAAAACVVWGSLVHALGHGGVRRGVVGLLVAWMAMAAWVAPMNHEWFASVPMLMEREDAQLAWVEKRHWTLEDRCRANERAIGRAALDGRLEDVLRLDADAPEGCHEQADPGKRHFNRLGALVKLKRFEEALPLAEALLRTPGMDTRERPALHYLAGVTLAASARPEEALKRFREAEDLGYVSCGLQREAAGVSIALSEWAEAARRFEAFHACVEGPGTTPILLDAARAWRAAGDAASAERVLRHAAQQSPSPAVSARIQAALRSLKVKEGVGSEKR
jgi:tetratricopeptide (TPR) repeat protein